MRQISRWTIALAAGVALGLGGSAYAGSFKLNESNAASMGRANAGDASANKDASAAWYNPALLAALKKSQFMLGATNYVVHGSFSKISATDAAGQPLSGGNGGNFGSHNQLGDGQTPSIFFATPIAPRTVLGVGLTVPFGLSTGYGGNSVIRYQAQYTYVAVNNIGANIGYQVTPEFSVGFGLNFARAEAKLTNKVDSGAVCFATQGPALCNTLGLYPQSQDGFAQVAGSDNAYGWNLGLAWHHGPTTIGFSYRSRLFFTLSGNTDFKGFPALFKNSGAFVPTGGSAGLDLPDTFDFSLTQDISPHWRLSGSVSYIRWGIFNGITVKFTNPLQPPTTTVFDYRNVWYIALGADYRLNANWTLHGGIAYDESPVRTQYREPRLPDYNRRWVAFGATWNINPANSLSFSYAHLFINSHIPMNHTGSSGSTVIGTWGLSSDLFSVGYQYRF